MKISRARVGASYLILTFRGSKGSMAVEKVSELPYVSVSLLVKGFH